MSAVQYLRLSPITTAWLTCGWSLSRFSIFCGATYLPPEVLIRSFLRSVMRRKPSASNSPMSPVWNQPSRSQLSAADADRPVEQRPPERAARLARALDAPVELLVDARHGGHEVRAGARQVLGQVVDAAREGRDRARRDAVVLDQTGKGVRERQEEEVDVALARDAELEQRLDGCEVVAVGLEHALGRPRGARSVDDGGELVALQVGDPCIELPEQVAERVTAALHERRQRLPGTRVALDRDH